MSTAIAASYMQSWLNQDEALFLGLLAPDVLVVESYGPVYRGHAECAAWFRGWHGAPAFGRVTKWELGRSYFDAGRSDGLMALRAELDRFWSKTLATFKTAVEQKPEDLQ